MCYYTSNRLQCSVNLTFMCPGKLKHSFGSLYWGICFPGNLEPDLQNLQGVPILRYNLAKHIDDDICVRKTTKLHLALKIQCDPVKTPVGCFVIQKFIWRDRGPSMANTNSEEQSRRIGADSEARGVRGGTDGVSVGQERRPRSRRTQTQAIEFFLCFLCVTKEKGQSLQQMQLG